jgi:hypothetical protein
MVKPAVSTVNTATLEAIQQALAESRVLLMAKRGEEYGGGGFNFITDTPNRRVISSENAY